MKNGIFSEAVRPPASIFGMVVAVDKGFQEISNFVTLTLTQGRGDLEKGPKKCKMVFSRRPLGLLLPYLAWW